MTRTVTLCASLIIAFGMIPGSSPTTWAAVPPAQVAEEPAAKKSTHRLKAKLVRARPKMRQVMVLLKWKGPMTLDVAPDAKITRNGRAVRLHRLRHGDQLRLTVRPGSEGPEVVLLKAWMPL